MMIEFARFLLPFLAPLPMGLLCVLFALFCLLLRLRKTAIFSLVLCLGIFAFFGYGLTTRGRLHDLERQYPPLDLSKVAKNEQQQIKFVVVLGSSHITDPGIPETGQLGSSSLYRLAEGIRLQRELPDAWLVISGGVHKDQQANAVVVGRVAQLLGVDGGRMIIEERPRDTFEEAKLLRPLLKDSPFILVTSAAHMARAVKLFQGEEMKPVPAPTDFILKDRKQWTSDDLLPSCSNLEISRQVIYEWLGNVWSFVQRMLYV